MKQKKQTKEITKKTAQKKKIKELKTEKNNIN